MGIAFKSPGVSAKVLNLSGPTGIVPTGIPAGVVGTAQKGPAFVPTTVASTQDLTVIFGAPTNDRSDGLVGTAEWLRSAGAATFIKVLGVGDGTRRKQDGINRGSVASAGFVVGDRQPQESLDGNLGNNPYAVAGGPKGRTYILGAFMSQSNGSATFTDSGLPAEAVPVVRGVLFAASGVLMTLSSALAPDNNPDPTLAGTWGNAAGAVTGSVKLSAGAQEFVILLNGHTNSSLRYPNVVTASFDIEAPNYLGRVLNKDPYKLEEAGYCLYVDYALHPSLAVVTGSGMTLGSGDLADTVAFLASGSNSYNSGSTVGPNFENFEDRYRAPKTTWITSQNFGGKSQNLFRIHSLDDGPWANDKVKISIEGITPSLSDANLYGTFDIVVRDLNDNDKNRIILEAFRGLSLNPDSQNFIARVIGDQNTFYNLETAQGQAKLVTEGDYTNNSKYIRVELNSDILSGEIDPAALPFGFRGAAHLVTSGSGPLQSFSDANLAVTNPFYNTVQMPVPFRQNLARGTAPNRVVDKGLYWGVQFERKIDPAEPNKTNIAETSIAGFSAYFPDFHTDFANVVVSDNAGTPDSATLGILDADRFNKNAFSLENVKVAYNPSDINLIDSTRLVDWEYVRGGNVPIDGGAYTRALSPADLADPSARQLAKFSLFMQGGFDGVRIFNSDTANLKNTAISEEIDFIARGGANGPTVSSYNVALDLVSDATEMDIQLFALPGIRADIITDRALQVAETRFDALYLMDIPAYDTNNVRRTSEDQVLSVKNTAVNFRDRGINSSFGAVYFPDVQILDQVSNVVRTVPASVAALGAYSFNDSIAYPWFAPAGFARGALNTTRAAELELSRQNMDDLYEVNINPIVQFAGSGGPVIWGQKTLLATQGSLDRVNVRRLLLSLRRQIGRISNRIVFEQGLPETLDRFSQLVNPILKRVQDQKGLARFLVKIDTSTTTEQDFENKTIRGKIFIQPVKSLEFLDISFVINNANNFGQG